MTLEFSDTPGRRPYSSIISSQHKDSIDDKLFAKRQSVLKVHRWLVNEMDVDTITYQTLNRYRNNRLLTTEGVPDDTRRREVRRDLKYLAEVVKRGKAALAEGLFIRPADAIQAIQLRARLLEAFPDVSGEREAAMNANFKRTIDEVLKVVTNEQRLEIMSLIRAWDAPSGTDVE